jgi:hypothetical protein
MAVVIRRNFRQLLEVAPTGTPVGGPEKNRGASNSKTS